MDTLSWTWLGKLRWGPGPWVEECDKRQWQDPASGLPCLAVRGPLGAWCGYVAVPPGHPFFGIGYHQCALRPTPCHEAWCGHAPEDLLEVHGGLTYSGRCHDEAEEGAGICHIPAPGEETEAWWLGFDCSHAWDATPGLEALRSLPQRPGQPDVVYRTLAYVQVHCATLAHQLDDRDWKARLAEMREHRDKTAAEARAES